jgi:ABC-type dipeptide/oligopeptide/nickel transport system permease subunit
VGRSAHSAGIEVAVSTQQASTVSEFDVPPAGAISDAPDRSWRDSMAPLLANKLALLGAALTIAFLIISIVGMVIIMVPKYNDLYLDQSLRATLLKPGEQGYLLGTDNLGRSMAWRLAAGTAVSLFAGIVVTILSISVGMILGCLAGYKGGLTDRVIGFFIDLTWGFPVILVAVILVGMLKPGLWPVILAISIVNWAGFARIVRAQAMSLNERAFVEAAHALGVPGWKIVLRHLVPNMLGTVLVMSSYYIAVTVIAEAGMAFIGLGAQPPTPSLGQMVSNGRSFLTSSPWVVLLPGLVLALLVLGLNTLGDGLRDYFDPRLRRW